MEKKLKTPSSDSHSTVETNAPSDGQSANPTPPSTSTSSSSSPSSPSSKQPAAAPSQQSVASNQTQVLPESRSGEPNLPAPKQDQPIDRHATTQIGQVIQGLGKLTQRLPLPDTKAQQKHQADKPVFTREEIASLILALGDTEHPNHTNSLELLVEMGHTAVSPLKDALNADVPWLTSYRAAEALGRIADGRATSALIHALRHPNSNVRWSAVRALAQIGDLRALFELRRVAQEDQGRTSWGESVAGAAHSALEQIQSQSVWSQSVELIKTSITSVLMILSLILAFSVFTTLRKELDLFGNDNPALVLAQVRSVASSTESVAVTDDQSGGLQAGMPPLIASPFIDDTMPISLTEEVTPTPFDEGDGDTDDEEDTENGADADAADAAPIMGKVLSGANVRPSPSVQNEPIGAVNQGDEIIFLGVSSDGMWYHIKLGTRHADSSSIDHEDGSEAGWIHRELVSTPKGKVPVEEVEVDRILPDDDEDETVVEEDEQ
jgi:hypothetical protein